MRFASAWVHATPWTRVLVRPDLVAEISAGTAVDRDGVHRYPLRFKRLRLDVATADVPRFG
ncbi:hypothetical protein ACFWBH_20470 [Streptomyces sp. NPDC059999]|uniref:hypothetical protein n=1 Tax=Streptomyces sp. NPDC059999 TaxID=3347030 RepID=UPI00369CF73F